jgi:ligand-binding SRPBCC domain-containing protein
MPTIELETQIQSSLEICFDLARSIDLHKISTERTNETAIDGTTSGLINLNEFVTWQATHFGIRQKLTSTITAFNRPFHFRDEQLKGAFKFFTHDHYFERKGDKVLMKDVFTFQSPFGFIGKLFDKIILIKYMKKFLIERNNIIKEFAETRKWETVLKNVS